MSRITYDPLNNDYECDYCHAVYFDTQWQVMQHQSKVHFVCPLCPKKYTSWYALKNHCRESEHSRVCEGCYAGGKIWLFDSSGYKRHIVDENVCEKCERHFGSHSNLIHHNLKHLEAIYACSGCSQKFRTFSGKVIHWESGSCNSGVHEFDLGFSAARCFQWKKYFIRKCDREDLLAIHVNQDAREYSSSDPRFYKCPTCDRKFFKLSGLFMHVESPSCNQTLDEGAIGKLRVYLSKCHG
ncbi:hypothetical protein FB567DRAFT_529726 [Paraphoma chrysanthemicola]|uniref:C2H2-type domain-containing protein n=1 Tax=Paraphoma chrysanthemicola TaxID=798071 RepID=A0A8K0R4B8_9PLEO|nr:hypothetical protein FB567DRAFT_529726 [Paraphoma chrysanthemicola]